jgi:hypothetical protein
MVVADPALNFNSSRRDRGRCDGGLIVAPRWLRQAGWRFQCRDSMAVPR